MPVCTKCKTEQPVSSFNKQISRKVGYTAHCKSCLKIKKAMYYQENRDAVRKKQKSYNELNKDKSQKRSTQWRLNNPEKVKENRLKIYGISLNDKETLFKNQKGCCAICNNKIAGQINIDHCHTTGKVREILCSPCNFLLGNCKDNPSILQKAIEYLKKHNDR